MSWVGSDLLADFEGAPAIAFSGGLDRAMIDLLERERDGTLVELPLLAGAAVVPELPPGTTLMLGWPNRLGRLETGPREGTIWVGDPNLAPQAPGRSVPGRDAQAWKRHAVEREERLGLARRLAKRIVQRRGVRLPWQPETPVVVAIVPVEPASLELDSPWTALTPPSPGLPGAVKITIPTGANVSAIDAYAARLIAALEGTGS